MAIFSYNLATDVGKVRLLIMDNQATNYLFSDGEIEAFLLMETSSVRRAAALALETMASNDAYVLKRIELLDLKTDGPATSKELRARAADLRTQADREDAAAQGGAFDFAEWAVDETQRANVLWNDALRGGG